MINANSEFKSAKCSLCGKEKECFIQYKAGVEHPVAVCPYCLSIAYCY